VKRIIPPTITFHYANASDSEKRLQMAYNRILEIARKNLTKTKQIELEKASSSQDSNN
jgi:hypothetical protein